MKPPLFSVAHGLIALIAVTSVRAAEPSAVPFRALSFESASQAAASENKFIFIDFYTTWCEPCKRLDATTWTNAAVGKLIGDKAVPLKIDAEKEKDLAQRYKIDAYPTLLLLKSDGTEIDRLVGFREPAIFTEEFTAGINGKPALVRAADALAAVPSTGQGAVQARYDYARVLAQNRKNEEALAQYLWCYDDGMLKEASFGGVRNSFLLSSIADLGRHYPPALAALRARRDHAEQLMLSSSSERKAAQDLAALNGALNEDDRTLAAFDQLPPGDPRRSGLLVRVYDLLIKNQRYADAAKSRPLDQMESTFERNLGEIPRLAARPHPAGVGDPFRGYVIHSTVQNIEVLIGSGQLAAAHSMADRLLDKVDRSEETQRQLRESATRAGHPEMFAVPAKQI